MPATSTGAVGTGNVSKAVANREVKTTDLAPAATYTSPQLITAGLPRLTFVVTSGQAHSIQVQPQIALRRSGVGVDAYEFIDVAPIQLSALGTPAVVELNFAAQAIRVVITNPGAAPGNATNITVALSGTG